MNVFAAEIPASPEAIVNVAIAAKVAADAASQSYLLSVIILGVLLGIGFAMMFIMFSFRELARNTDGMREDLVQATRKLALIEGNLIGRAEKTQEMKEQAMNRETE